MNPTRASINPDHENSDQRDRAIAYLLFRVFVGVNIALHGISRLAAGAATFQGEVKKQFAHAPLPHAAVALFALVLPWAEALVGLLILAGLFTRIALIGGALLMIVLTFGTSLVQDWQIAGVQLIYAIAYLLLLCLLSHNRWSIDAVLQRRGST